MNEKRKKEKTNKQTNKKSVRIPRIVRNPRRRGIEKAPKHICKRSRVKSHQVKVLFRLLDALFFLSYDWVLLHSSLNFPLLLC